MIAKDILGNLFSMVSITFRIITSALSEYNPSFKSLVQQYNTPPSFGNKFTPAEEKSWYSFLTDINLFP